MVPSYMLGEHHGTILYGGGAPWYHSIEWESTMVPSYMVGEHHGTILYGGGAPWYHPIGWGSTMVPSFGGKHWLVATICNIGI